MFAAVHKSGLSFNDVSEAMDTGFYAAACFFNNPAGNVKAYVHAAADRAVDAIAETYAAEGMSRRQIEKYSRVNRAWYLDAVRTAYQDAMEQLKGANQASRRALVVFSWNDQTGPDGTCREIGTIDASRYTADSHLDAARNMLKIQEKFDAAK